MVDQPHPTNHQPDRNPPQPPASTQRHQPPGEAIPGAASPRRRTPLWTLAVLAPVLALACLVAVPVAWFAWPIIKVTTITSQGAACPECAVDQYVSTGPLGVLGGHHPTFQRVLCHSNRTPLTKQATEFATTYRQTLQPHKLAPRLEIGDINTQKADQRTVAVAQIQHITEKPGGTMVSQSTHQWTFQLVNNNGWRVCAVDQPTICAVLVTCQPDPATTPTPTAAAKVWDTRVPYRCLPDRPYRDLEKNCPDVPTDWIQPGPYYCAPDQPFGIPATRKTECANLGWT